MIKERTNRPSIHFGCFLIVYEIKTVTDTSKRKACYEMPGSSGGIGVVGVGFHSRVKFCQIEDMNNKTNVSTGGELAMQNLCMYLCGCAHA